MEVTRTSRKRNLDDLKKVMSLTDGQKDTAEYLHLFAKEFSFLHSQILMTNVTSILHYAKLWKWFGFG